MKMDDNNNNNKKDNKKSVKKIIGTIMMAVGFIMFISTFIIAFTGHDDFFPTFIFVPFVGFALIFIGGLICGKNTTVNGRRVGPFVSGKSDVQNFKELFGIDSSSSSDKKTKTCPICGHKNSIDAKYCVNCRAELDEIKTTKTCKFCGTENDLEATYCKECGQKLN